MHIRQAVKCSIEKKNRSAITVPVLHSAIHITQFAFCRLCLTKDKFCTYFSDICGLSHIIIICTSISTITTITTINTNNFNVIIVTFGISTIAIFFLRCHEKDFNNTHCRLCPSKEKFCTYFSDICRLSHIIIICTSIFTITTINTNNFNIIIITFGISTITISFLRYHDKDSNNTHWKIFAHGNQISSNKASITYIQINSAINIKYRSWKPLVSQFRGSY